MTVQELIDELRARGERIPHVDVFAWDERGGSLPVRGVSVQGTADRPVVVLHVGEGRQGRMGRQA